MSIENNIKLVNNYNNIKKINDQENRYLIHKYPKG